MKVVAIPVALVAVVLLAPLAVAQGGPPFRSDDPGTPGDKHWEMNVGLVADRKLAEGSYSLPNIDINYGLGDRIQLKYELPLAVQEDRADGGRVVSGLGNSLLGFKYRFYEYRRRTDGSDGDSAFAFSVYPQLVLNNPTRSLSRGIVGSAPQLLLPVEGSTRIGPIRISGEIGYWFTGKGVANSWVRALIVGHEFGKKTEFYLELYDQADVGRGGDKRKARESTAGLGGRRAINRTGSALLIGMAGRSLAHVTPTNGQPSWIACIGVQLLFGANEKPQH